MSEHIHNWVDITDVATWPANPTTRYYPPAGVVKFVEDMRHPAFGWRGIARFCTECGWLKIDMTPRETPYVSVTKPADVGYRKTGETDQGGDQC